MHDSISDLDPADWLRLIEYARHLCVFYHGTGKMDRDGNGHWIHCLAVGERVYRRTGDPATLILGYIHDLREDTDCPDDVLMEFPWEINVALVAISRGSTESANTYFRRVLADPLACQVKLDDIEHNFAPHRADEKIMLKAPLYAGWHSLLRRKLGTPSCFCSVNPTLHCFCECSGSDSGHRLSQGAGQVLRV